MPEENLTVEEAKELYEMVPAPGSCPHGTEPVMTSTFGRVNACNVCFQKAKKDLLEKRAAG